MRRFIQLKKQKLKLNNIKIQKYKNMKKIRF